LDLLEKVAMPHFRARLKDYFGEDSDELDAQSKGDYFDNLSGDNRHTFPVIVVIRFLDSLIVTIKYSLFFLVRYLQAF
jgi:hypothetical protein